MAFLKSSYFLAKLIIISALFQSCLPIHALWLGQPDKKDAKRFRSRLLPSSESANIIAKSMTDYGQLKINDWTSDVPVFKSLKTVLSNHHANGFMLIRNDTILYEDYFRNASVSSQHASYSVAKSFVSLCVGIAIEKKWIKSLDEPIINYLPQLAHKAQIDKVRIHDILNHTSGICLLYTSPSPRDKA